MTEVYLTYNNVTQSLVQWAKALDMPVRTLRMRLYRGWSHEAILTTPIWSTVSEQQLNRHNSKEIAYLTYKGVTLTISQWTEYRVVQQMIHRCTNPNNSQYKNYGGRGIKICERWLDKNQRLQNFLSDMGPRPSPDYSLDRINNDGNYEPNNCRWATRSEQAFNRRDPKNAVYLTYEGVTLTITEWSRVLNMPVMTLRTRFNLGWSDEDVLTTPVSYKRKNPV